MKYEKVSNFICIISLIYEELIYAKCFLILYRKKMQLYIHKILETSISKLQ